MILKSRVPHLENGNTRQQLQGKIHYYLPFVHEPGIENSTLYGDKKFERIIQ